MEVSNAVHQLEHGKLTLAAGRTALDLAQKALAAAQRKYELGAETIFFVLDAQTRLAEAESTCCRPRSIIKLRSRRSITPPQACCSHITCRLQSCRNSYGRLRGVAIAGGALWPLWKFNRRLAVGIVRTRQVVRQPRPLEHEPGKASWATRNGFHDPIGESQASQSNTVITVFSALGARFGGVIGRSKANRRLFKQNAEWLRAPGFD